MRSHPTDPIRVPDGFWSRPAVAAALDARDVGGLFRLIRQACGASQTRIGIAVGMPQSHVSAIMSEGGYRRVITVDVLTRIADGLELPPDARRRLGLATGGSPLVADDADPWTLVSALTRSSISGEMVDRFERVAVSHAARYPSTPPSRMWPTVRTEIARVEEALQNRQTLAIQRRLVRVAGILAGIAGNLSLDVGAPDRAHEYFEASLIAGADADDPELSAWSLAMQSIDAFVSGAVHHAAALLDQADALVRGGGNARRRAWISALRARAYAGIDRNVALAALEDAYMALSYADAPAGIDFFDQHRLDGLAGVTHLLLGETGRADELIEGAIVRRPTSDAKGRALLTLDRAAVRVADAEPDGACELVVSAVDIANGQLVRPVVARVHEIRASMRPWQGTEAVRRLDDRLATIGHEGQ